MCKKTFTDKGQGAKGLKIGGKTSPFAEKKGAANSIAIYPSLGEDHGSCSRVCAIWHKGDKPIIPSRQSLTVSWCIGCNLDVN